MTPIKAWAVFTKEGELVQETVNLMGEAGAKTTMIRLCALLARGGWHDIQVMGYTCRQIEIREMVGATGFEPATPNPPD